MTRKIINLYNQVEALNYSIIEIKIKRIEINMRCFRTESRSDSKFKNLNFTISKNVYKKR